MEDVDNRDREQTSADAEPLESEHWREDARQWYLELLREEHVIAPWLSLEWTGERMKVRRG